jgi:hypothetical protein
MQQETRPLSKSGLMMLVACAVILLPWSLCSTFSDPGRQDRYALTPTSADRFVLTPSPSPGYAPMAGLAYVTTSGTTLPRVELLVGPEIGKEGGVFLPHGTQVEILESFWYYEPAPYRSTACYLYHIRDPKTNKEGWLEEDLLTKDLAKIPVARCFPETPVPPRPTTRAPLVGRAFVTTLGTQNDSVDFWSDSSLESSRHYLFSKPHGTPVEIVRYQWLVGENNVCYDYQVRTEDGLTGWVAGSSLTQDLSQPSREADCRK